MKNLVVLTGAGISAESGIRTFRDMGGLWEEYDVMEVASPEGWFKNPELVTRFYNERRMQLADVSPNYGHIGLFELEKKFNVHIITQNVDDLHERAGSSKILHLHGELTKVRSTKNSQLIKDIGYSTIKIGDLAEDGAQLRPHIVWFGEAVPAIEKAAEITSKADIFVIIGTSLNVYPAAGLINYTKSITPVYIIDPNDTNINSSRVTHIKKPASIGVKELMTILIDK